MKENPSIFKYKKKSLFCDDDIYVSDELGRVYDSDMCHDLYDQYRRWNLEAKSLWIDKKKSQFKSYTDFMVHKLEIHIAKDTEEVKEIKRAVLKRLLKAETVESGCATMVGFLEMKSYLTRKTKSISTYLNNLRMFYH